MKPVIDHVQITVQDVDAAEPFYDKMLAILGFDVERKVKATLDEYEFKVVEYPSAELAVGINSPRAPFANEPMHRRKPGALHHLAFKAVSPEEVDRVARELEAMGAPIVGGPKLWPQHGPDYYAVFFKDLEGVKFEVVHCPHPH